MSPLALSDDERWRAVKARDPRFDGRFIVGVRSTGIYCRPSCPTPIQPLRRNVDFYATTAGAQRGGLRACKRCRPDAVPGSPEWNLRDDLVGKVMRRIASGWLDRDSVTSLAHDVGVTDRHLRRLMIEAVGAPPLAIARAQRAQNARVLIETTSMSFSDIAFAAGFGSQRQFNDTIRQVFAEAPSTLRAKAASRQLDVDSVSGELSLRLAHRSPIAADVMTTWFAQRAIDGVAAVEGDELVHALRLRNGSGVARLRFAEDHVAVRVALDDVRDLGEAVRCCRTALDLDCDPQQIDTCLADVPVLRALTTRRPGLRSPGSADGFATVVFALLGQQRSVKAARTIACRLVERARAAEATPIAGLAPFPRAAELAELDLSGIGLTSRLMQTIRAVSERFVDREHELGPAGDRSALRSELLDVHGIGPWTADYVAMRVLADPDVWLGGDLIVRRQAERLGLSDDQIATVRPWRSYLTHHLWAASSDPETTTESR